MKLWGDKFVSFYQMIYQAQMYANFLNCFDNHYEQNYSELILLQ